MRTLRAFAAAALLTQAFACAQTRTTLNQTTPAAEPARATLVSGGLPGRVPDAGMLRFPDVGPTHIVFVYANDLWLVPRAGGTATPLASPPGSESFPRFSPSGETVAFMGNYDGDTDLYTIPTAGGPPSRVTHHPATETLCDWVSDSELLFDTSGFAGLGRQRQLFTVPVDGGLPTKLPVPYGTLGSISDDGEWLAYTPHSRDARSWKRYRGGMATDIWLFHLTNHTSRKITDWEGTDSLPMWHGGKVYYMSDDGEDHRLNVWEYDPATNARRQITRMPDYDVKWPSMGPGANGEGEIVFQNGPDLVLVNLGDGSVTKVPVMIPGDRPKLREKLVEAKDFVSSVGVSATGKRAVIEARGDIWTVPAKHGSPINLTRTDGVAERGGSWSPDGKWIAYFSDDSGEYDLYLRPSDGKGDARKLTSAGDGFLFNIEWSPNSEHIYFCDKAGGMFLCNVETGDTKQFDREPFAGQPGVSWSSDSRWIAYDKGSSYTSSRLYIYDTQDGEVHEVTSGMFPDSSPVFDREGKYLYYISQREFTSPRYEDVGTTFIYADTGRILAVPLRDDVGHPLPPKSDHEEWEDGDAEDDKAADEKKDEEAGDKSADDKDAEEKDADESEDGDKKEDKKDEPEPVEIEFEGFERRAILLPMDRGTLRNLAVSHDGKLIYVRRPSRGNAGDAAVKIFDPTDDEKKEKTVVDDYGLFVISADGKKLLLWKRGGEAIVDAAADQKVKDKLDMSNMRASIDPRAEWRQVFREAWRIMRDYFYDPNMHGVNWEMMYDRYVRMLEDCASREDVQYVIAEMIAELNVGHAYARGVGDGEDEPRLNVGLLGCDFELDRGAFRISKILEGGPWDANARGPLSMPGVDVSEGDYLLAINTVPLDTSSDPWEATLGMAGATVTLTVSDKPTMDDDARDVVVELLPSERTLRYHAWIEANRKYVEEKTDGRVGYIYVQNTGVPGQNDLVRQFFGQTHKEALIIDERWNGGGQIPTRFVEILNRPAANYWARRDGRDWLWPPDSHQGPKCMLINGLAGSGGDYFPWWFKEEGVGKLIGMRTWGGLVGLSGNPQLIDRGGIRVPTFGFYETDGTWGIEGHGVDPDMEVIDDPALMADGGDPQLDAAIEHMLDELRRNPYRKPERPEYPDRSGMGIPDADK